MHCQNIIKMNEFKILVVMWCGLLYQTTIQPNPNINNKKTTIAIKILNELDDVVYIKCEE